MNPLRSAGEYWDGESSLYYLRARYYDPSSGQFIWRDPEVATTRQPYAYVADNPVNLTDPSGLCGAWDFGCYAYVIGSQLVAAPGALAQASSDPQNLNNVAVGEAGLFDSLSGGLFSKGLGALGGSVRSCSAGYQLGQSVGLPLNVGMVLLTLGGDPAADASASLTVGKVLEGKQASILRARLPKGAPGWGCESGNDDEGG